jgi:hypothetical protein
MSSSPNSSGNSNNNGNNGNNVVIPPLINPHTTNQTITEPGLQIVNEQGLDASGNYAAHTVFTSTNPELYDPNISQDLVQVVNVYDDNQNTAILNQIKDYASKIQCSDFHGKGTIDDYASLFEAASKIATETKQIQLDIDIDGFNEFGAAADELSNLFQSFTLKLQNVNIINDTAFLTAVSNALQKIWNLSETFGKFKETILTTTTIQFPKTAHDTKIVLEGVMNEIDCAMRYITNFVEPTDPTLVDAELSSEEKNIIAKAVNTIDNWNAICEQGVTIAMSENSDVQYISQANTTLKTTTNVLKTATQNLRNKLNLYLNTTTP